jgi:uncharacterized membrane protein
MSSSTLACNAFSIHDTLNKDGRRFLQEVKNNDNDQFRIVSIFHFVLGGFQMLFSLIGFVYLLIGVLMTSESLDAGKSVPPPEIVGWIVGGIGVVLIVLFLSIGFLSIRTGINISRRKHHTFCIVMDSILCLMVPFGTIVGIFGLLLLTKQETAGEFEG